jgi:hypothetical protein
VELLVVIAIIGVRGDMPAGAISGRSVWRAMASLRQGADFPPGIREKSRALGLLKDGTFRSTISPATSGFCFPGSRSRLCTPSWSPPTLSCFRMQGHRGHGFSMMASCGCVRPGLSRHFFVRPILPCRSGPHSSPKMTGGCNFP